MVAVYPNEKSAAFFVTMKQAQKGRLSEMIETKAEVSKDLEKALQALELAKQRVANKKRKRREEEI